jgi:hypothetical protein
MRSSAIFGLKPNTTFNVVIVYDDFVSGQRAVQTYHRFMLQHGDIADVNLKTWTFDLLKNAKLNHTAIEDAAKAQIIILAAECEVLPAAVEKWLQGWRFHENKRHGSFIAVLNPAGESNKESSPVEDELQSMIPETGSDFLIEKSECTWQWRFLQTARA